MLYSEYEVDTQECFWCYLQQPLTGRIKIIFILSHRGGIAEQLKPGYKTKVMREIWARPEDSLVLEPPDAASLGPKDVRLMLEWLQ